MPDEPSFREFIERIRRGDGQAAAELVHRYEPAIRRAVRIQMRRDARLARIFDSMDVCQSILASFFTRAACGAYDLDGPEDLMKLLASMARHKLLHQAERQRALKRDYRRVEATGVEERQLAGAEATPSRLVAARDLFETFRARLAPDERYLADQRGLGREWAEIAAEVGESPEALRKRLRRAVDRAAHDLDLDGFTDDAAVA
jgi:RNA polymerase sigma-70 factor (ECF subfamily)